MRKYAITIICLIAAVMAAAADKFVLVIDAGHGGHDAGAVGAFSKEKNINLKAALAFGRYVEQNCPDVKVIYTRKTDVFIPLHQRADIANKNHADAFISVHTNSLPAGRIARGFETYTMGMRRSDEKLSAAQRENSVITYEQGYQERYAGYDPNSPESAIMFEFIHDKNMAKSVELAKLIQKEAVSTAGCQNKGVKQDVFLVLRETSMPACLVELGFISTPDEENRLNNDEYIEKLAYGIYSAFVKYKSKNSVVVPPYIANTKEDVVIPTLVPDNEHLNQPTPQTKKVKATKVHSGEPATPNNQARNRQEAQDNDVQNRQNTPVENVAQKESTISEAKPQPAEEEYPVFKVQFMTGTKVFKEGDSTFKGITGAGYYRDGNMVKYTLGECQTFAEAAALKKTIADKFPDAFIVAFHKGQRIDLTEARRMQKK